MSYTILITGPRLLRDWEKAQDLFAGLDWKIRKAQVVQRLSEAELIDLVGDVDGVICGGDEWTAAVMDAAPNLKAICKWGTGIDAIDLQAARQRNIIVRNVPDAFSVPVADHVFAFMLAFSRNLPWMDQAIKAGNWLRLDGTSLAECTLGVIGVGNIGSTVLRRARAFGMRCLGTDPVHPPQQLLDETAAQMVDLDTLLAESDFVSVNCDLNPTSRHLMSAAQFKAMKKSAVLINTARGPIVDQQALIDALQRGEIAGAGLDVFETEPVPPGSPLTQMDNVLMTPHLAQSSERACWATHRRVVENMKQSLADAASGPGEPRVVVSDVEPAVTGAGVA